MTTGWSSKLVPNCLLKHKISRENQIKSSEIITEGSFPVVDQGQSLIAGFTNDKSKLISNDLPYIIFGDHTRCFKFIDFPFILGADGTKVLKPDVGVFDSKFFYFALLSINIPSRGYNRHFKFLKEKTIQYPAKPEQHRITAVLSLVQRAIGDQERLIQLTTELKKSLMHKLFTDGTRGEPQKQTEIGSLPESWEVVELGKACIVQTGIAKGRKIDPNDAVILPYLRVANVQDGYLDLSVMKEIALRKFEIERYSLKDGDVVLTEGGDLDKLGRGFIWHGQIKCCVHQNHIFAVRPKTSILSPEFLAYQVQSPYGKAYFLSVAHKTTNLACINTSKLKGFPLLLPSSKEQKEIVNVLSIVDKKCIIASRKLEALKDLFRTLLHQLMTAQIRVDKLDLSELGIEIDKYQ